MTISKTLPKAQDRRVLGAGLGQSPNSMDAAAIIALFREATDCEIYAMQTVAKVQWGFNGPLKDADVQKTLGAQIQILGSGANPSGVSSVTQTEGLINGEFQAPMLACAIGVHLEPEPLCWVQRGNANSVPAAAGARPFSPDVFTIQDQAGGLTNPVNANLRPALCEWGYWANKAMWHMVRGYNLRWSYGSHVNIMDEQLRDTAYMPPNSQDGSAGESAVAIGPSVRQMNDYYVNVLGSTQDFLEIDTVRVGSVGAGAANAGQFSPSRDFETADATFGGMDLPSMLKGVSEFRTLDNPYVIDAGVPPGLFYEEANTVEGNKMRAYFSATYAGIAAGVGAGVVPPNFADDANYTITAGAAFTERTLDGLSVSQQLFGGRVYFKGGTFFMSIEIKGIELTPALALRIKTDDALRTALCRECGCRMGWPT